MWASRFAPLILQLSLLLIAEVVFLGSANGQPTDELAALNRQVEQLIRDRKRL